MKILILIAGLGVIGSIGSYYWSMVHQEKPPAWIYLCGLTSDFNNEPSRNNRAIMRRVAEQCGIAIIPIHPPSRNSAYNDMWNWPHSTEQELYQTYHYVLEQAKGYEIAGLVGFSNGGFFLNKLAQYKKFSIPVISIGAAGGFYNKVVDNNLYLIAGKQDEHHYEPAQQLYKKMIDAGSKNITFFSFNKGHEIPEKFLTEAITNIYNKGV
jgi:predicted esterase